MSIQETDAEIRLQVERLLNLALDIVVEARCLLQANGYPRTDDTSIGSGGTRIPVPAILDALSPVDGSSGHRTELLRRSIQAHFSSTGRIGAGILLRLLQEPGEFISHDELARSAKMRSPSGNAVKVYISNLRNAMEEHGWSPMMIETGLRSYRLDATGAATMMDFFTRF